MKVQAQRGRLVATKEVVIAIIIVACLVVALVSTVMTWNSTAKGHSPNAVDFRGRAFHLVNGLDVLIDNLEYYAPTDGPSGQLQLGINARIVNDWDRKLDINGGYWSNIRLIVAYSEDIVPTQTVVDMAKTDTIERTAVQIWADYDLAAEEMAVEKGWKFWLLEANPNGITHRVEMGDGSYVDGLETLIFDPEDGVVNPHDDYAESSPSGWEFYLPLLESGPMMICWVDGPVTGTAETQRICRSDRKYVDDTGSKREILECDQSILADDSRKGLTPVFRHDDEPVPLEWFDYEVMEPMASKYLDCQWALLPGIEWLAQNVKIIGLAVVDSPGAKEPNVVGFAPMISESVDINLSKQEVADDLSELVEGYRRRESEIVTLKDLDTLEDGDHTLEDERIFGSLSMTDLNEFTALSDEELKEALKAWKITRWYNSPWLTELGWI